MCTFDTFLMFFAFSWFFTRIHVYMHPNICASWLDLIQKNKYKQKVKQNVGSYSLFCSRTFMHLKRWTIHAPQNASFSNWYTYFGMDSMNLFSLLYNIEKEKKHHQQLQQRQNSNNNNDRRMMSIIEECTARTRWHWTHLINLLTKWNAYNRCWIWATLTCRWD